MTTPKEAYQQAKLDLAEIQAKITAFEIAYSNVDNYDQIDGDLNSIIISSDSIETWINDNLLAIEQNEVMNGFLQQLKVIMTEYDAVFEIGSSETGYGQNWGGSGETGGIRIKVEKDGVSSEKVFEGNSFSVEDL